MPSIRPKLRHTSPAWVEGGATHFITICAAIRARHILNKSEVAQQLLASARSYHPDKWWCRIWLIMPDHVHGLVSIPNGKSLAKTVGDWKRFTAKAAVIQWQENFFDHRLRRSESLDEKAAYIRAYPARAGLVRREEEWPWIWVPENPLATPQ